jgi:hypothetical protein
MSATEHHNMRRSRYVICTVPLHAWLLSQRKDCTTSPMAIPACQELDVRNISVLGTNVGSLRGSDNVEIHDASDVRLSLFRHRSTSLHNMRFARTLNGTFARRAIHGSSKRSRVQDGNPTTVIRRIAGKEHLG